MISILKPYTPLWKPIDSRIWHEQPAYKLYLERGLAEEKNET